MNLLLRPLLALRLLLASCFGLVTVQAWACDACNMFDYNATFQRRYLGLVYRYRVFNGYSELNHTPQMFTNPSTLSNARIAHEFDGGGIVQQFPSRLDYQRFNSVEVRYNHTFELGSWSSRLHPDDERLPINVTVMLPYQQAEVHWSRIWQFGIPERDSTLRFGGLGDFRVAIDPVWNLGGGSIRHIIRPGLMVKLPTGVYNTSNSSGRLIDQDLQPGAGSLDLVPRLAYQFNYENMGFEWHSSYRFSGIAPSGYRFGNALNLNLNTFYLLQLRENWRVLPILGLYHEQEGTHLRSDGSKVNATGYQLLMLNTGLDVQLGSYTLQLLYQHPLAQSVNGLHLSTAGRASVGVIWSW